MGILFCNIGWMEFYRGQQTGDKIVGGGAYVNEHGHGFEVCNFVVHKGFVYGSVETPGKNINIRRICGRDADSVNGVLIIWTAPREGHAPAVVVGWYRDATVYRSYQKFDSVPPMHKSNRVDGYRFKVKRQNAVLLPVDSRAHTIPKHRKGLMGQSNIWYADTTEADQIVQGVRALVAGQSLPAENARGATDPEHNAKVEKAAVNAVYEHYVKLGYVVESVEMDNVGWDLEAKLGEKARIRIEVKGLSGPEPRVGLTPNEYDKFVEEAADYRLAIVTGAISETPELRICRFSTELGRWTIDGHEGCTIKVERRTSAMVQVST